jgi:hypothetical protein
MGSEWRSIAAATPKLYSISVTDALIEAKVSRYQETTWGGECADNSIWSIQDTAANAGYAGIRRPFVDP